MAIYNLFQNSVYTCMKGIRISIQNVNLLIQCILISSTTSINFYYLSNNTNFYVAYHVYCSTVHTVV